MEIDDDSDVDDLQVLTCVKHVTFLCKLPPYEVYKISQVMHNIF